MDDIDQGIAEIEKLQEYRPDFAGLSNEDLDIVTTGLLRVARMFTDALGKTQIKKDDERAQRIMGGIDRLRVVLSELDVVREQRRKAAFQTP